MDAGQRVVVGMDPHKRSVTIEVMNGGESVLGGGRFSTDVTGFQAMSDYVRQWPDRTWAVEGCGGIGRHIALRLLAAGEQVVDVPPKLSARARVFSTGQGRKTDATDAHSVALVGTRVTGLRPVVADDQLAVIRMLADRRRSLGEEHTRKVSQLHALLLELLPGGRRRTSPPPRPRRSWLGFGPATVSGRPAAGWPLNWLVTWSRSTPVGRPRTRSSESWWPRPGPGCWTCTASIDASSGDVVRHRLSRKGNRQINRTLHIMATVQLRNTTEGRAYYDRKKAAGKSSNEAMRCLKRRLSDAVYRTMLDDAVKAQVTGPGGQRGSDSDSSATGSQPQHRHFGQATPGPVTTQPKAPLPKVS